MGGRGKKSANGARSKPKRVKKVACTSIDISGQQLDTDPWSGLRYVQSYAVPAVHSYIPVQRNFVQL